MALKSDSQGFLIGDVVTDLRRNNDQLNGIRADVRDIKSALLSAMNSGGKGAKNAKIDSGAKIASPISRRASDSTKAATPARSKGTANVLPPAPKKAATPNGRDASTGKFTAKNAAAGGVPTPNVDDKKSQSIISNLASRITSTIAGAAAGAEEADPAIKAFTEVSEPMMRGYQTLFGGGDKKEHWYKKIWKELNIFRKDETVFNKAEAKVLKNIENKPVGGVASGGGIMSSLGGLLSGKGIGGLMGGLGKGLLGGGKGLLKKIPFLGALIGGIGAASDVFGNEEDGSLTRGEKDKRNGKSVGGAAGSFGGMMAGAAAGSLLGPVGTVVGGAVGMFLGDQAGQKMGEKMGEWTTQLRDADIPGKIISAWDSTTEAIKSGWDGALKLMSDTWGKTKDAANAANDFVKDKTGIDVKEEVKNAYDSAVNFTANEIIPPLANLTGKGVDKIKQGADWVGENTTLGKGAKAVVDSGLFDTTRKHRPKKGNAETAMKVLMDKGWSKEQAAGIAANLAAESGFDTNAVGDSGKAKGIAQWHPDRQKKFEEVNGKKLSDASFEEQVGFVDWELRNTEKKAGDKIRSATTAEQAAALTERHYERSALGLKGGVQPERVGAASKYAEMDIAEESPQPKAAQAMPSLADDPTQGGRYKYEKLEGGQIQVTDSQTGVMELASDEQANAFRKQEGQAYKNQVASINAMPSLHSLAAGPRNPTQIAYAAAPKVPTFSPVSTPAEAPPVKQYLASNSDRNTPASAPIIDVGQDIKDRNIAHIVTGGFSGRG